MDCGVLQEVSTKEIEDKMRLWGELGQDVFKELDMVLQESPGLGLAQSALVNLESQSLKISPKYLSEPLPRLLM